MWIIFQKFLNLDRRFFIIDASELPDQTWRLADMFLGLFESQWTTECYDVARFFDS